MSMTVNYCYAHLTEGVFEEGARSDMEEGQGKRHRGMLSSSCTGVTHSAHSWALY